MLRPKRQFRGNQHTPDPHADAQNCVKTSTLEIVVKCNIGLRNMPTTVAAVETLLRDQNGQECNMNSSLDCIVSDKRLRYHLMLVDNALDARLKARIEAKRGTSFFGFGFCTDESPPEGARLAGLRFQITWVFVPWIVPLERWGAGRSEPLMRRPY